LGLSGILIFIKARLSNMRIRHISIAIVGSILLITFSDCNRKKEISHPPITKICLATDRLSSNLSNLAIEIDSSLKYKFYGGENASKSGLMEGEITKGFWDTLQEKFTEVKYWNIKESYEDNLVCERPPPPYFIYAIIHYGKEIEHINLIGAPDSISNVFYWIMNSYKNIDLKRLPPDEKLSFEIQLPDTQRVYTIIDATKRPTFGKDSNSLSDYLSEHINFPKREKKEGIEATVYTTFIIEKDGSVSNAKIIRDSTGKENFNMEVLRVINSMPKWNPARNFGTPIRIRMILPVRFKLE
jgi:TonB family protein